MSISPLHLIKLFVGCFFKLLQKCFDINSTLSLIEGQLAPPIDCKPFEVWYTSFRHKFEPAPQLGCSKQFYQILNFLFIFRQIVDYNSEVDLSFIKYIQVWSGSIPAKIPDL